MPNKVVHFKSIGAIIFFRNRRSKSIKLSIKPDGSVLISYPFYVSEREVLAFLAKNEEWIRRHKETAGRHRKAYRENDEIKTKLHTIVLKKGELVKVKNSGSRIELLLPDFDSEHSRNVIEDVITQVYRFEARKILPGKLEKLARMYGFEFNKVSIRNNKRNWGSCSSKNNISLNLQMMKLPDELIDYILLHELVHTEIKNHSPEFWQKMDNLTGNRGRELAKEVKKYSTYTL